MVAAGLCLVLPGLGIWVVGSFRRWLVVGGGMAGLLLMGLVVGGPGVVDRERDRWWWMLQSPGGVVVWGVDAANQRLFKGLERGAWRLPTLDEKVVEMADPGSLSGTRRVVVALGEGEARGLWPAAVTGREYEVGAMGVAAMGLLNVMAMVVCLGRERRDGEGGGS